ncbi:MAG: F0F1 ATP synthase subunit A [bacterium]
MSIPEITISGEKIFEVFNFPVTNTLLLSFVITFSIIAAFSAVFKKAAFLPGRLQNFFEWILESLYNFFHSITLSKEKTIEIFPIAATLFLLILASNLMELVPGVGIFHFLRSPSSDLNFTLPLALFSILYINFLALRRVGLFHYLKKFINIKNPILFFVGFLEGIGEMTRIFSLAIRLFGNLFAGEVLLIVTSFLFAYLLPLPFLGLEIMVAVIQAFIFSSLIVIFYASSVQTEHG